jgi:hypothetical protein
VVAVAVTVVPRVVVSYYVASATTGVTVTVVAAFAVSVMTVLAVKV